MFERWGRHFIGLLISGMLAGAAPAGLVYDEAVDGDFSDDGMQPTVLNVTPGFVHLAGTVGGYGIDDDFFLIVIAPGWTMETFMLDAYSSELNQTFLGIEDEAYYETGHSNPEYFGYYYFSQDDVGTDLLPLLGESNGNFTPPLEEGAYSFWVDESGPWESYAFTIQILLMGDLNCDGVVNAFDIDPFILTLVSPEDYETLFPDCNLAHADFNGDGVVNAFDIDAFVEALTGD